VIKENVNSFVKRFLNFSIGPLAGAFIGFITLPVTTWLILPEEFGKVAMFTLAFSMISMFLFLGIDVAFVREFNAKKDKIQLFWNSLTAPLTLSIFISIILLFNEEYISRILFDSHNSSVMYSLAISLPFSVIVRFNMLVVRMEERGKLFSMLTILQQLSKFIFVIILVIIFERTFVYIVIAQITSVILQSLVTIYFVKHYWISPRKIEWTLFKLLFLFGLPFIPTAIIEWVFNGFDKIALRKWADFSDIGLYSAGFKIVALLSIIKSSFTTFWIPTAYRWHDSGEGKKKFQAVNNVITSLLFILGALVVLFRNVIFIVLADDYQSASIIIPFLLFLPILGTIKSTTGAGIVLSRKTYYLIPIYITSTIANIIGNWILVPNYGAMGASIATGISFIITFWLFTIVSRKLWRIKLSFELMIINTIAFLFFAFISLLQNVYFEILSVIVIILINYKSIIYLQKKIPVKDIMNYFKNSLSIAKR
jgi:O-antigen/teichoic acid export membrane protein